MLILLVVKLGWLEITGQTRFCLSPTLNVVLYKAYFMPTQIRKITSIGKLISLFYYWVK
jgi:hypothetical protein